jgi:hypothetical protein
MRSNIQAATAMPLFRALQPAKQRFSSSVRVFRACVLVSSRRLAATPLASRRAALQRDKTPAKLRGT